MPTPDEISLYHIVFCRYPGIPVPSVSFFPQMRYRQFVQDIVIDLDRDGGQHISASPFIEGLFKIAASQTPSTLKGLYERRILPIRLLLNPFRR
jgi:hypothetical protein